MSDINDKKIQELKDILKALGFYENKKLLGYVKKIDDSLTLFISFFNKDNERIILKSIDVLFDVLEIKVIYFVENGYKITNSKYILINQVCYVLGNKTDYIKNKIDKLIESVLERV